MEEKVENKASRSQKRSTWPAKNLLFLLEFMKKMDLSVADISSMVKLTYSAVVRWFLVDDTNLSKVITIAEKVGCDFQISYIVPDVPIEKTRLVIDKALWKLGAQHIVDHRLSFLQLAMHQAGITNQQLAQKLNISRNSFQRWISMDDISFSRIYQIADVMGWTVNIEFRAKTEDVE